MPAAPSGLTTDLSLLSRLRRDEGADETWEEFVRRYGSLIHHWCLSRGLSSADADDVTQNVLIRIVRVSKRFRYDPAGSFRGWLRRVTENAVVDFFRSRRDSGRSLSIDADGRDLVAPPDLIERLNGEFDLELFEIATARVRTRVNARRFTAWEAMAFGGREGADVAATLGMPRASVYAARFQVQELIEAEIRRLESEY